MFELTPEKQHPLSQYVIAVLIVWAVILAGLWFFDRERFDTFAHVCGGFLLSICAMYIAMHLYRSREGSRNRCTSSCYERTRKFRIKRACSLLF